MSEETKPTRTRRKTAETEETPAAVTLKVLKLRPDAILPTKAHETDLCFDLYTPDEVKLINKNKGAEAKLGIALELPEGYGAVIRGRSGLGRQGVAVLGGEIDNGYRGEIIVLLRMTGENFVTFNPGDRVAQIRLVKMIPTVIEEITEFSETTERGEGGFGSSGS